MAQEKSQKKQDSILLKEVTIQTIQPSVSLKMDKKIFFVGKDALSQNGSVHDLLNGVPSVTVDPSGQISLRGNPNVNVLINGRKTGLVKGNALDQLSADQIEKIEVITNPSARYDASGSAGIINIVLKKNKKAGFSGQLKLVTGLPNDARITPSLNYKSEKINFFSTFGYRNSDYIGLYSSRQFNTSPALSPVINTVQHENRHDDAKNLYAGADFYLNTLNTITLAYFKNPSHDNDQLALDYTYSRADQELDSTLLRHGRSGEVRDYNQVEFNYTKTFKTPEKKWTVDVLYDFWNSDKNWGLEMQRMFPNAAIFPGLRTSSSGTSKDLVAQTDFVWPVTNHTTIEMGIKLENRTVRSDFIAEQQNENIWAVYHGIDNSLRYNEKIGGAYVQFARQLHKFSYMLGLRAEFSGIQVKDQEKNYDSDQQSSRLFPSLHASYQVQEGTTLQWNYSKRINRPSLQLLYPFTELTDLNYQFTGNPNLQPSYADVFEFSLLKTGNVFTFNPSVYYQHIRNSLQNFTYHDANQVIISTPINIAGETRYGLELSMRCHAKDWLNINAELNAYQFHQNGRYEQINLNFSGQTLTSRLSLQFKLPEQISFQTRYNLSGAQSNAQSHIKAIHYADIGISKNLWKDKCTVSLDGSNIFNSRQTRRSMQGDGYVLDQVSNFNGARYRLSFVYRFNLKNEQSIRQAKSGNRN